MQFRSDVREGVGRPLVICNGIGASLELLQPFVDAMEPDIPILRFDVPGVGGSPLPRFPYSMAYLAREVARLVQQLGHRDFDVLGISWGGALAQQIAFQNPRRCHRLILVSTAPGWMMVPASPRVLRHMMTARRYRDMDYASAIAPQIYGGAVRRNPKVVQELLDGHSPLLSRRGYALQLLAAAGWASLPLLPLLRQRTLVVSGIDDPIIPLVNAKLMAAAIPGARLETFDDGHLGLITSASTLAPMISAFLRDESAA